MIILETCKNCGEDHETLVVGGRTDKGYSVVVDLCAPCKEEKKKKREGRG